MPKVARCRADGGDGGLESGFGAEVLGDFTVHCRFFVVVKAYRLESRAKIFLGFGVFRRYRVMMASVFGAKAPSQIASVQSRSSASSDP